MPPRTLFQVNPRASYFPAYNALDESPKLSKLVSQAIALSAEVDLMIALMIIRIVGGDAATALAIFETIRGGHWQENAIIAAANSTYPDSVPILKVILRAAELAQKERHKLAHWIWGKSVRVPNVLLLADPKTVRWKNVEQARLARAAETGKLDSTFDVRTFFDLFKIDNKEVLVYAEEDLKEVVQNLGETHEAIYYFRFYFEPYRKDPLIVDEEEEKLNEYFMHDLHTREGALRRIAALPTFTSAMAAIGYTS